MTCLLYLSALIIIGILLAIVGYIVYKGLAMINLDFIMQAPRRAGKEGGISSTIVGTLYLTVLSLAIAAPLGVGTAIHLEEYAQKESYFAYLVTLTAETLAAIPSIIY
ncbi:MAG TPA: phosphate ABC transporter, permease protein PstA, partial [Syntrophomonas wolfei]|nr:phosphate ABC transporter, permease protein PstA [Syntrophomonas wolfei]